MRAYSQSKLANILFTRELTKRLANNSHITTYCLHPGIINSELTRHTLFPNLVSFVMSIFCLTVEMGAQTTLYCALEETIENESGLFYE